MSVFVVNGFRWHYRLLLLAVLWTCSTSSNSDYFAYKLDGRHVWKRSVQPTNVGRSRTSFVPTNVQTQPGVNGSTSVSLQHLDAMTDLNLDLESEWNDSLSSANVTNVQEDHHTYYNTSQFVNGSHLWIDIEEKGNRTTLTHEMLSNSHRRAATVKLSFDFPIYGHPINNVTIATGGFLYTGDYMHSWLAATQYVAPLMANFDTSIKNDSYIIYSDNGTVFTVQWEGVVLHDMPDAGEFTFQVNLYKSGDISFVYKSVPVSTDVIEDHHHPVRIGLSDAYIIDRVIFLIRRKTIYEYHRVELNKQAISNDTAIFFKALPTCVGQTTCESCLTEELTQNFQCIWCDQLSRCSDGMDRNRQDWLIKGCDKPADHPPVCNAKKSDKGLSKDDSHEDSFPFSNAIKQEGRDGSGSVASGVFVSFLMVLMIALGVMGWVFYAYRNPQSSSGQFLIRYRPAAWRWPKSEVGYTAASTATI